MADSLLCIARGHEGQWEAVCLDFNLAAQGRSLEEVKRLLTEAVATYIEDASKEDDATRSRLLHRRAPLSSRLRWTAGLLWATLCGRRLSKNGTSNTPVPFEVPCPA